MKKKFPDLELILIESGGDNLAATFSPELVDLTIYMIDVAQGADIPVSYTHLTLPTTPYV